jgi:hypothetical protein
VTIIDPLSSQFTQSTLNLLRTLVPIFEKWLGIPLSVITPPLHDLQSNGYDCGPMTFLYASRIVQKLSLRLINDMDILNIRIQAWETLSSSANLSHSQSPTSLDQPAAGAPDVWNRRACELITAQSLVMVKDSATSPILLRSATTTELFTVSPATSSKAVLSSIATSSYVAALSSTAASSSAAGLSSNAMTSSVAVVSSTSKLSSSTVSPPTVACSSIAAP